MDTDETAARLACWKRAITVADSNRDTAFANQLRGDVQRLMDSNQTGGDAKDPAPPPLAAPLPSPFKSPPFTPA